MFIIILSILSNIRYIIFSERNRNSIRENFILPNYRPEEAADEIAPIAGPYHDWPVMSEAKTSEDIITRDSLQDNTMQGGVLAAGPAARDANGTLHVVEITVGDRAQ